MCAMSIFKNYILLSSSQGFKLTTNVALSQILHPYLLNIHAIIMGCLQCLRVM